MARKNKTSEATETPGFAEAPQAAFVAADEARPGFGVANRLQAYARPWRPRRHPRRFTGGDGGQ